MTKEEIERQVREDGYCIIPGVISPDEVVAVRDAVWAELEVQRAAWEAEVEKMKLAGQQLPPSGMLTAEGLINGVPAMGRHVAHPAIAAVCDALLGFFWRISAVSAIATSPGNKRGYWHADWPYNHSLATSLSAPYADACFNLSAIIPLTEFAPTTGSTVVVPRSHRIPYNPTGGGRAERMQPRPDEVQITADPGDALFYDSRLWHCVGANCSSHSRIIVTARYSPWWLNLQVRRRGSAEYRRIMSGGTGKDNSVPLLSRHAFDALAPEAKPLFMHWVEE